MSRTADKVPAIMRERAWKAMRRLKVFTFADLAGQGIRYSTAKSLTDTFASAGILSVDFLEVASTEPSKRFTLVLDVGRRVPRVRNGAVDPAPSAYERMWAAMQVLGVFDVTELRAIARIKTHENCRKYVQILFAAGYLVLAETPAHMRPYRYRMPRERRTGPVPPAIMADGSVWDVNREELMLAPRDERAVDEPSAPEPAEVAA